jgi:hypothetical protein
MKTPLRLLCLLSGLALSLQARAQQPSPAMTPRPEPPPGPLIQKRAPDSAMWTITTVTASSPAAKRGSVPGGAADRDPRGAAPSSGVRTTYYKRGKTMRVERIDEQKQSWNVWWTQGTSEVLITPQGKVAILAVSNNPDVPNPYHTDFSASDFQGFEWISASTYTGLEKLQGVDCLVFQEDSGASANQAEVGSQSFSQTAYIDLKSRLPILLVQGDHISSYEWKAAPPESLTVPPEVRAALEQKNKSNDLLAKKAARPF